MIEYCSYIENYLAIIVLNIKKGNCFISHKYKNRINIVVN